MRSARPLTTIVLTLLLAATGFVAPFALGADPAGAYPSSDVVINGHGYGHGRGLGQYGAYGYATKQGWDWVRILDHFYGGTTMGSRANADIGVRLVAQDGIDLTVTSGKAFTAGGVPIAAGGSVRFALDGLGNVQMATSTGGCTGAQTYYGAVSDPVIRSAVAEPYTADLSSLLTVCQPNGSRTYRGALRMISDGGVPRTINVLPMEAYLRGVVPRESPSSWGNDAKGMHALNAQAVAARSYAWAESRYAYAKTCDTETCQVYGGAGLNGAVIEAANTDTAIANTWQAVRLLGSGSVARTEFSSSTGGHTAGGTFPAVEDLGDEVSPHHNWQVTLPVSRIEQAYTAIGTLDSIEVTSRNGKGADGGRVLKIVFRGSKGNLERTGEQVRVDFGLKSNWFTVSPGSGSGGTTPTTTPSTPTTAPPGSYPPPANGHKWIVPAALPPASESLTSFIWGNPGGVLLLCDWNGDGVDSPGVFRDGRFYISNTQSMDPAGIATFPYGVAGDVPLCGDWNGDRVDTIGIWRAGQFHLRNENSAGPVQGSFRFGNPDDTPMVGDWNGDRADTPGIRRGDRVFLANTYANLTTDATFVFGSPGDRPIVGDWDGNGTDEVGVQRGDRYHLSDGGSGLRASFPFGIPSDVGIIGRFANSGPHVVVLIRG